MTAGHRAPAISAGPVPGLVAVVAWNCREGHQERVWYHSLSQGDEIRGAAMTGPEHYRRAEELAAEAHRLLGQGDGQATAGALGRRGPDPCGAGPGRGHRGRRIRCG